LKIAGHQRRHTIIVKVYKNTNKLIFKSKTKGYVTRLPIYQMVQPYTVKVAISSTSGTKELPDIVIF
jgi:hypothetical protein